MEISRREFLKLLGVATAGASLGNWGCDTLWSVPDKVYEQVGGLPRIETWKNSICSLCPAACGIRVRLIDGIPVRIQGNPMHPVNRGGICPMAEAGIEALFNPDRIKHPLKRAGERGEDKWESISWEQALQDLSTRLRALRENNQPHKLAFLSGARNNLLSTLIERFMQAFGSPNAFVLDQNHAATLATYLTQGHHHQLAYRCQNVDLLINFGADLLDAGPSPVRFNQLYSELRNREDGQRTKIIHLDTRLSRTAGNSNEWLAIKPGTMAALALALANVLIKDGQYDKEFVQDHSFGFNDWQDEAGVTHLGFKTLVQRDYSAEKVADITGIPAASIVELARELGAAKSALVLAGGQAVNSTNGLYTVWSIACLNALKGNLRRDGRLALSPQPPLAEMPAVQFDDIAAAGLSRPGLIDATDAFCFPEHATFELPRRILEHPEGIEVLLLANANPVFSTTNQDDYAQALRAVPFIVSFSPFLDETTLYADLILPDHSFLEKHEVFPTTPTVEYSHLGVQQPVVAPLYDTRHTGDVLLQLATALGGTVSASLPWPDYGEYLQQRLRGVYETGAGTIFTERMDESWLKFLKERGWQIFDYTSFEEFWQVLLDKGGWWDPFPSATDFSQVFATPSKKFEFYSQLLEQQINARLQAAKADGLEALLQRWKIAARGDTVFLPHYEHPGFDIDHHFALHLLPYNLITNSNGMASNLPLAQELFGILTREYWSSWIEINPETAHELGIAEADIVRATSPHGSLEARVKLLPGVMPGVVHIPFGLGHRSYGRYAKGIGVNPYEILSGDYDPLSGEPSLITTKISVAKVNRKEVS